MLSLKQQTAHDPSVLLTQPRDRRRELDASDVSSVRGCRWRRVHDARRGAPRGRGTVGGKTHRRKSTNRTAVPTTDAASSTATSSQREGWATTACNTSRAPDVSA